VKQHIRQNVRSLFNRKKDKDVSDLLFYNPVQEDNASIRTGVPTLSRDVCMPAREVRFFQAGKGEIDRQELGAYTNQSLSGRALVSVPYAYTLNKNAYGVKSLLCTLEFREKPEDEKVVHAGVQNNKQENSGMLNLGDAFQ
jgi:hypothetical protein